MSTGHILHAAIKLVEGLDKTTDKHLPREIAEIVKFQSKGAAVAALASGWLPGVGALAAATISAGFIWVMYAKINTKIGLSLSENILKTLASGVATNLASYAVGMMVVGTALSFLPVIGSIGASVLVGGTIYGLTLASGYVYLNILIKLFKSGKAENLKNVDINELQKSAKKIIEETNIKEILKNAQEEYKQERK